MTHPFSKVKIMDTNEIIEIILNEKDITGISFSGGEPLEYPLEIIDILNKMRKGLNSIIFSGYTLEEVLKSPSKMAVIRKADLSILGRYNDSLPHPYAGKKFVLSTDALDLNYFKTPVNMEYVINGSKITKSGIFKLK